MDVNLAIFAPWLLTAAVFLAANIWLFLRSDDEQTATDIRARGVDE